MTDDSDPRELARRYVELWEDHATALAQDPAVAATLARMLSAAADPATMTAAMQAAWGTFGHDRDGGPGAHAGPSGAAPGAPAAAAAPGGGADDVDELRRRVADLEARLAALESGRDGSGGDASG